MGTTSLKLKPSDFRNNLKEHDCTQEMKTYLKFTAKDIYIFEGNTWCKFVNFLQFRFVLKSSFDNPQITFLPTVERTSKGTNAFLQFWGNSWN